MKKAQLIKQIITSLTEKDYSLAWILLTFLGVFGVHRFYLGKWGTGILYLLSLGIFGIGLIYDFWTLNSQISELNLSKQVR